MIDKRSKKDYLCDIGEKVKQLSDTEIVLTFADAMTKIYPNLVKLEAHCYDPYDDVTEPLFDNMVYGAFTGKYGIPTPKERNHTYGGSRGCYHNINHIIVKPKKYPVPITFEGVITKELNEKFLSGKELVFIQFGDTINYLSGDSGQVDISKVNFNFTEAAIVSAKTGEPLQEKHIFIQNSLLHYELVAEDCD